MAIHQLEFFKEDSDLRNLKEEINTVRVSSDKVRKGLFARHNELAKMYIELKAEFEFLKRKICKGD